MTKPNKQKTDWEKEFNYNFPDGIIPTDIDNIKDFISQILKTQREEIISEIEGIVGEDENYRESTNDFEVCQIRNQLRKEIIDRLKQIIN